MKKNKLFAVLLSAIMCLYLLAGCSNQENVTTPDTQLPSQDAEVVESPEGEAGSGLEIVDWEPSELYTDEDIQSAVDTVLAYFETEFKGCTLTQISYPGDDLSDLFDEYAKEYQSDEAIILRSSFDVDSSGGDGSLEPNSTYEGWQWILVRSNGGIWEVETYGYG